MSNTSFTSESRNGIGQALKVFAWATIIVGFFLGLALANVEVPQVSYFGRTYTTTEFSWTIALTYWSVAFVSGLVFLGFSEIIMLLQKIVDNGGKTLVLPSPTTSEPEPEQFSDLPNL